MPKPGLMGHPEWTPPASALRDEVWYNGDKDYQKIRVWFRNGQADQINSFEYRHDLHF